ncbi:hypothetical protein NE237_020037 [Protea cynaroides]|uniref:Uncharacterized protein n=1 Tax=Protea cynaroides TaxID=273540 RepID=A0A9Q0H5A1_9MAGN|nr:hypothetical protein NE237_020037 [Protea cynaroides]
MGSRDHTRLGTCSVGAIGDGQVLCCLLLLVFYKLGHNGASAAGIAGGGCCDSTGASLRIGCLIGRVDLCWFGTSGIGFHGAKVYGIKYCNYVKCKNMIAFIKIETT